MGALDANTIYHPSLTAARVKYNLSESGGLYALPKAQELILICEAVAPGIFYNSASNYDPIFFDLSTIDTNYGDQIFFNPDDLTDFIILDQPISGECLLQILLLLKDWKALVIDHYLKVNLHYLSAYRTEVIDHLMVLLDESYVMPDASTNYYTLYGPTGPDIEDSDWLRVFRFNGDITQRTVTKTGATLKWQFDDSIYDVNNPPSHAIGAGAGWCVVTSSDDFANLTVMNQDVNNWSGQLPVFNFPDATEISFDDNNLSGPFPPGWVGSGSPLVVTLSASRNTFTGEIPSNIGLLSLLEEINLSENQFEGAVDLSPFGSLITAYFNDNLLTEITSFGGTVATSYIDFKNNYFPTREVDRILEILDIYFQANTPIQDFTLDISGSNAIPTDYVNNVHILSIESIFTTAGYTATIIISLNLDTDAKAYINALHVLVPDLGGIYPGLTDTDVQEGINQFFVDAKGNGATTNNTNFFAKLTALYPFIGATDGTHKFNALDPQDLDSSFRLTFLNSPTHSVMGMELDGVDQYANTHMNQSVEKTVGSEHISVQSESLSTALQTLLGVESTGATKIDIDEINTRKFYACQTAGITISPSSTFDGFHLASGQDGSGDSKYYLDGSNQDTSNEANTGLENLEYYLGCLNNAGSPANYLNGVVSFATIGDYLTPNESQDLYDAANKFYTKFREELNYFVTEWNLPLGSFTFPAGDIGTYNAEIDFGDGGGWKTVTAYNDANLTNVYASAGTYQIKVRGTFPWFSINNGAVKDYITEVVQWGDVGFESRQSAFYGASNLASIPAWPTSWTLIYTEEYYDCTSLSGNLIIPDHINSVGISAFRNAGYNGTLTLSANLTIINRASFSYLSNITGGITIPEGVTEIDQQAFRNGSWSGSLSIASTVTIIEVLAFNGNSGLTGNIVLPSGLTSLGGDAFFNCSGFTGGLIIPSGITIISADVFYGCSGLNGAVVLPSGITSIGSRSFFNCSGVPRFDLYPLAAPTVVNVNAFTGVLAELHILSGSTGYDVSPWIDNPPFTSIVTDDFVMELDVPTTSLTIPAGDTGTYNAVVDWGDGSLSTITSYDDADLTHTYDRAGTYKIRISGTFPWLYFNNGTEAAYVEELIQWGDIGIESLERSFYGCVNMTGSIEIPSGITAIGDLAFYLCDELTGTLTIPSGITSIGSSSFNSCIGLTGSLSFPSSLTSLGGSAFYGCSGFTGNLSFPIGVTVIPVQCFRNCTGFTSLTLHSSMTAIGDRAFFACNGMSGTLTIPDSVTDIQIRAFRYTTFSALVLGTGETGINSFTFADMPNLSVVNIPSIIISIGANSFLNCGASTFNLYPSTAPSAETDSFDGCLGALHIPVTNSGYNVSPWTDNPPFTSITADL